LEPVVALCPTWPQLFPLLLGPEMDLIRNQSDRPFEKKSQADAVKSASVERSTINRRTAVTKPPYRRKIGVVVDEVQDRQLTLQLLDHADAIRRDVAPGLALKRKSALGQFMTPAPVARFMASLFPPATQQVCHLLDAGAGVGALSFAFLDRLASAKKVGFRTW
jgi:type I restriction-modification system DNA methylase subunit